MSKAKILVFTDPHFEAPAARMAQAVSTMNWICDLATEHQVDAIVCTGDVTNRAILTTPEEVAGFNQSMTRMANLPATYGPNPNPTGCIPLHFVTGNHDKLSVSRAMSTIGILEIHPSVTVHTEFGTDVIGTVPVAFLPYGVELGNRGKARLLFSHVDFTGIPYNFTGYEAKKGYTLKDVQGYEKVFNGHIHLPSTKGNLVNTGSVLPQKMDYLPLDHPEFETLLPKVIILEVGDDDSLTLTEFKNPHATLYLTLDVTMASTLDHYLPKLVALAKQHLVHCRVVCSGDDLAKASIQTVQPYKSDRLSFRVMERVNAKQTMTVQESTAQKVKSIDDVAILDRVRGHVTTAYPELKAAFEDIVQRVLGVHQAETPEPWDLLQNEAERVLDIVEAASETAPCSGCGFDPKTDKLPEAGSTSYAPIVVQTLSGPPVYLNPRDEEAQDLAEIASPVDPLLAPTLPVSPERAAFEEEVAALTDEEAAQYLILPPGASWDDKPDHSDDCGGMLIGICDCWGESTYRELARMRRGKPGNPWDNFVRVEG